MQSRNLVTSQPAPELWETLACKAEAEKGKRVLARSVAEIRKAADRAIEAGADWWQFHEHSDNSESNL
jgi:hypothetical protein